MNSSAYKCVQYIMNAIWQVHEKAVLEGVWVYNDVVEGFWDFECQHQGWCVHLRERRQLGDHEDWWFLCKHDTLFPLQKFSKTNILNISNNKFYSLHPQGASGNVKQLNRSLCEACFDLMVLCVLVCLSVCSSLSSLSRSLPCFSSLSIVSS